jgi:PBSX family phage terminase large subunit
MIVALQGKAKLSVKLATARFNVWEGAVRSSKTVASTFAWMKYVRNGPAGNLAMIGKTERTLKRNVIDPIIDMVGPKRARYLAGSGEFWLFGRRIYTAGANDIKAVQKIQGLTLAGGYGDEISTWPKELWEMLGTRLSVAGAQFFGTCNPDSPVHWLKRDWLDRSALWVGRDGSTSTGHADDEVDLHRFTFTLDDNPHLPPDYVAALKRQYVGLFYRRYILGDWVPAEGAIFDMFDEDRHIVAGLPVITRWLSLGVDHGTRNPFHAVILGLGVDQRLHLTREWRWDSARHRRQLSDAEYSRELRQWLTTVPVPQTELLGVRPEKVVVDPSATAFRVQLHQDGLPSIIADNEVIPGIRTLSSLFATGLLDIHESCRDLLLEIPAYCWDDKAVEKDGTDKPIKLADHGIDAMRYATHSTRSMWRPLLRHQLHLTA